MTSDDRVEGVRDTSVLGGGRPLDARAERLEAGAAGLATRPAGGAMPAGDRRRLTVAGAMTALGLLAILLGWFGAARSIVVAEQIPYAISGGLAGLGLTVAGGFGYFSHWHQVARREAQRAEARAEERHREIVAALEARGRREGGGDGPASGNGARRPVRRA